MDSLATQENVELRIARKIQDDSDTVNAAAIVSQQSQVKIVEKNNGKVDLNVSNSQTSMRDFAAATTPKGRILVAQNLQSGVKNDEILQVKDLPQNNVTVVSAEMQQI